MFSPDGTLISASAAPHCGDMYTGDIYETIIIYNNVVLQVTVVQRLLQDAGGFVSLCLHDCRYSHNMLKSKRYEQVLLFLVFLFLHFLAFVIFFLLFLCFYDSFIHSSCCRSCLRLPPQKLGDKPKFVFSPDVILCG